MDELYLEVFSDPVCGTVRVPLETLVTLFCLKYCECTDYNMILVLKSAKKPSFTVKIYDFVFVLQTNDDVKNVARMCRLPAVVRTDKSVTGLCAVLRQIVKSKSGDKCHSLLGFRQGCLIACAESSIWTRFCEVDIINSVNELVQRNDTFDSVRIPDDVAQFESFDSVRIPDDVARFEIHMNQPVRIHNIQKKNQDLMKSKRKLRMGTENIALCHNIDHVFAEGPVMTLADIILFPCFHVILQIIRNVYLQPYIPLTVRWYENMKLQLGIEESLYIIGDVRNMIENELYVKYILPDVPNKSLYKSDPKRYKPKNRQFTRQEDVDVSLKLIEELGLELEWEQYPFGYELEFDWSALPYEAHPEGGNLPAVRMERKGQQLENLAKAVLKLARPGHTIVDFCSGSGHLGIVLAYFLPRCKIILLENKEESLSRAQQRVYKLKLTNVMFYQGNIDYFCGEFDIGVSLHACGVATDLVIQQCINQNAVFICCPCCYGSVQNNHIVTYPRSRFLQNSAMSVREYLVLGHAADQTHDEFNVKTDQGKVCMGIIDMDRCLQAKELGYTVSLSKLIPETCTPKNNLLVGIPQNWF
ncbi:hypothetical protein L9F63_013623 [Diploptera punctata]|uniref:Methyltransferase domain-containing protein n=1 Tax=Diploptera punctata TaxID=6984 RepID=A0AAD8AB81_DIPPU|nr:hypothetical protein L9F63_013623 [Diploptera punctata]